MRALLCIVAAVLFFGIRTEVVAQDLLGLFFDGESVSSISGGNPFAPLDSKNLSHSSRYGETGSQAPYLDSWIDNIYRETRSGGSEQNLQPNVNRAKICFPLSMETNAATLHLDIQSTKTTGSCDADPEDHASYDGRDEYVAAGVTVPVGGAVNCDIGLQKNIQERSIQPGTNLDSCFRHPINASRY